ncbi:unnamed protein product, partial [Meganyctiphanes norvegica]
MGGCSLVGSLGMPARRPDMTSHLSVMTTITPSMILCQRTQGSSDHQCASTEPSGCSSGDCGNCLDECVICLERRPDVILPCAHAYCLPCIEQWWEYSNPPSQECTSSSSSAASIVYAMNVVDKTCPVCRESLKTTDDTWVLSEVPDNDQVNEEIRRALIGLAGEKDQPPG